MLLFCLQLAFIDGIVITEGHPVTTILLFDTYRFGFFELSVRFEQQKTDVVALCSDEQTSHTVWIELEFEEFPGQVNADVVVLFLAPGFSTFALDEVVVRFVPVDGAVTQNLTWTLG